MADVEISPRSGQTVGVGGRFRLEDRVRELGGASLWKATDELLQRPVAVYMLPGAFSVADSVVTAVRSAARVADPRLARIFDADYSSGCPHVVSEWVPGEHVEDLVTGELPGPALAAAIVADAADALAAAHLAGRPHLCLGPRSLRWGASGVKIAGLGIEAGLAGLGAASDAAAADARALARILYALLTGHWPGAEATTLPPAPRIHGRLCAPRQVRAGVPGVLSEVTVRALHPKRDDLSLNSPAQLAAELCYAERAPTWPARQWHEATLRKRHGKLHARARYGTTLAGRVTGRVVSSPG